MNKSHYGSNRITRTWVWRADKVESVLWDAFNASHWDGDREQQIQEAIKIIKGFRELVLEHDFIDEDYYPTDYVDGNSNYLHRRQLEDNDIMTPEVRLRSERRWQDGIRRQQRNAV